MDRMGEFKDFHSIHFVIILKIGIPYNSKYNFHLKDLTSKSNGCCEQNIPFILSCNYDTHWRRKWQPTPVLLPGESQGRRSLVGCHLWGRTESHTTEATSQHDTHSTSLVVSVCLQCGRPRFNQEYLLEKKMATHSSILAWKEWRKSMGSQRVGHDWATLLTLSWYS